MVIVMVNTYYNGLLIIVATFCTAGSEMRAKRCLQWFQQRHTVGLVTQPESHDYSDNITLIGRVNIPNSYVLPAVKRIKSIK